MYGPPPGAPRSPLLAFNLAGAGCYCATLAHRHLGLTPPASCRLSFALYSSADDVDAALGVLRRVAARRPQPGVPA